MFRDYSKYQVADYLIDDYFIDSMLNPTPETEEFWKECIDEEKIDINEFISAFMNLKNLHENKPKVTTDRINYIFDRIQSTNNSRNKKTINFKYFRNLAVACSIIGIISLTVISYLKVNYKQKSSN